MFRGGVHQKSHMCYIATCLFDSLRSLSMVHLDTTGAE